MFEKVNPSHPDKIADRIAGALVDMAYEKVRDPRIAVEVLIGHGVCHIIAETSVHLSVEDVTAAVHRIAGENFALDYVETAQDRHLAHNQQDGFRCGDNGIFKGTPVTEEVVPEVIPDHQLQNPPVYIIKAKDMMITNANQMKYEKEDGYVHFIPTGGDPNFLLFNNQTGSRYAVVKYRTEYQANIQIFLGSEGSGPKDDTTMLEQALIPDGQWHLAIFDTQTLVDRGVYDGTTAAFLRLDVMESGYVLDENGQPSKDENGSWLKLPLPEGATIDIAYFAFFETE